MNNLQIKKILLLLCLISVSYAAWFCSNEKASAKAESASSKDDPWYLRMADSQMDRSADSLDYGKSNPDAKWNYQTGLFLKALLDVWDFTGDQKYFDYTKRVIDSYLEPDGNIRTYKMEDFNIDKVNSGKVLLKLYKVTNDNLYKLAADKLRKQLDEQPRTKEGGFWHKKRYPWQMWLDGLYMGAPFYAEYSGMFNQPDGFDDVTNQIIVVDIHTRDPKTRLRYHAWDESNKQEWANPETGRSPNFWGRAMGWYAMALIDVLDFLPKDHPKRDKIIFILQDLYKAIATYQDDKTGLWYQVVDMPDRKGNYPEASASSMFVYAIAKAINKGMIDTSFTGVVQKGYSGIIDHFVKVDKAGMVSLTQVCSVAGLGGDPYRDGSFEYYISEPVASNDLKGVGPFIMASIQVNKMKNRTN